MHQFQNWPAEFVKKNIFLHLHMFLIVFCLFCYCFVVFCVCIVVFVCVVVLGVAFFVLYIFYFVVVLFFVVLLGGGGGTFCVCLFLFGHFANQVSNKRKERANINVP